MINGLPVEDGLTNSVTVRHGGCSLDPIVLVVAFSKHAGYSMILIVFKVEKAENLPYDAPLAHQARHKKKQLIYRTTLPYPTLARAQAPEDGFFTRQIIVQASLD